MLKWIEIDKHPKWYMIANDLATKFLQKPLTRQIEGDMFSCVLGWCNEMLKCGDIIEFNYLRTWVEPQNNCLQIRCIMFYNAPDDKFNKGDMASVMMPNGMLRCKTMISTISDDVSRTGFGTFIKDINGTFRWCVDDSITLQSNNYA